MPKFNMPSSSFSSGGQGFSGKRGQDLSTLMSHQNIGQFLDNIRHRVNKSMESGTKKLSKIAGLSKLGRLASFLAGPLSPLINLGITGYETIATQNAYKQLLKDVGDKPGGGFLHTEIGGLPEDIKYAKGQALQGNLLSGLISTLGAAKAQGGFFPKGTSSLQNLQAGAMAPVGEYGAANLNPDMSRFQPSFIQSLLSFGGKGTSIPSRIPFKEWEGTGLNPNIGQDFRAVGSFLKGLGNKSKSGEEGYSYTPRTSGFDIGGFTDYLNMTNAISQNNPGRNLLNSHNPYANYFTRTN